MTLENAILPLLLFAIAAVGAYAVKLYREGLALSGDKSPEWQYALEFAARLAVQAAEQLFKDEGAGADKLRYAEQYIYDYLSHLGIQFTEAQKNLVRGAIEAAVYELTREIVE